MFTRVNLGYVVEMEPTRVNFKIWGQHGIPELNGVNLGRGSNSVLNRSIQNLFNVDQRTWIGFRKVIHYKMTLHKKCFPLQFSSFFVQYENFSVKVSLRHDFLFHDKTRFHSRAIYFLLEQLNLL